MVADHADLGARAAAGAAALSRARTTVVSGDDLAAARWSHHLGTDGVARTTIGLPDGRILTDHDLDAVLFRSQAWQVPIGFRSAPPADQAYARAELTALIVSWLASLGSRALNAVEGTSPCGPAWGAARWRQLAASAGFAIADGSRDRSVVVAGTHVIGAVDDTEARRCLELAGSAGCRLLEVSFTGGTEVCDVVSVPLLLDPAHVAAAAALLTEAAA